MSEFVQALVPWVAGAVMIMFFIDAVLTVIKIVRGPSVLTRTLAADLLVSTLICAIGAEMVITRHASSMPLLISLALVAFVGTVAVSRFVARDSDDDGAAARERRLRQELAKRKLDIAPVADIPPPPRERRPTGEEH
ncbi:monovalent cation/H+ antiporter complex subunit F [Ammonicoccus fulvus]|uniref:Monovalent cation/H+ antiporter complex subunit F n=1 Tax=Ammonicoccus fulvus TaxID=3138240 RepID=A0ABZ3FRC9_9ACTN